MKHLGDITKIDGHNVPLVDVICGGSPCQDLSVAGKRAGLAGQRSGLFMDQIRIIKEMRDESRQRLCGRGADVDLRLLQPRFMVWENVPGAFSSNGGEDFRAVLEETARVVCEDAVIPRPSGRWSTSGCIMGDGWSIAWRVHDAQFWGVPQRRKRISLVADFGGESAPEILFERKGVSGNIAESAETGKEIAGAARENADPTICLQGNGIDRADTAGCNGRGWRRGGCYTLNTIDRPAVLAQSQDEQHAVVFSETASARLAQDGRGGVHSQMMSDPEGNFVLEQFAGVNGDIAGTLDANYYKGCGERQGTEREVVCVGNGQMCNITMKPIANSLDCMHEQQAIITYGLDRASFNQGKNAQYDFSVIEEQAQTLVSRGPGGVLTEQ